MFKVWLIDWNDVYIYVFGFFFYLFIACLCSHYSVKELCMCFLLFTFLKNVLH